jgi:hypothetical protein
MVPVDEAFVIPDLEANAEMRKHVQPARGVYRRVIIVMLDEVRRVDVFPEIEEAHAVESHDPGIELFERQALIEINNHRFPRSDEDRRPSSIHAIGA